MQCEVESTFKYPFVTVSIFDINSKLENSTPLRLVLLLQCRQATLDLLRLQSGLVPLCIELVGFISGVGSLSGQLLHFRLDRVHPDLD